MSRTDYPAVMFVFMCRATEIYQLGGECHSAGSGSQKTLPKYLKFSEGYPHQKLTMKQGMIAKHGSYRTMRDFST